MKHCIISMVLFVAFILNGCATHNSEINIYGYYYVKEDISGLNFYVFSDGTSTSAQFTYPQIIDGLTVASTNGTNYDMSYKGVQFSSTSTAVAPLSDFVSALVLLDTHGKKTRNKITASINRVTVDATLKNDTIVSIVYNSNENTRIFHLNGDVENDKQS